MPVIPDDLIAVLRGAASPEVEARVFAELADDGSNVHRWIREVEDWTKEKLRPGSPVSAETEPNSTGEQTSPSRFHVVRRAAFGEDMLPKGTAATIQDLLDVCHGRASRETLARVKAALDDPQSMVAVFLRDKLNER